MTSAEDIEAVIDSDITVVYQPIVELDRLQVVAYEALSRFDGESPAPWFDAAREHDLVAELDLACLRAIASEVGQIRTTGWVSVNLAAETLNHPDLDQTLATLIDAHPNLVIELSEDSLFDDFDTVRLRLDQIRSRGVRFALDDLGTGPLPLLSLRRLEPDQIKFDHRVLHGIAVERWHSWLLDAFGTLGLRAGIDVIAEGIETEKMLVAARSSSARFAQGFFWGEPRPL